MYTCLAIKWHSHLGALQRCNPPENDVVQSTPSYFLEFSLSDTEFTKDHVFNNDIVLNVVVATASTAVVWGSTLDAAAAAADTANDASDDATGDNDNNALAVASRR